MGIKEVAKHARVSIATVSRTLNNDPCVSADTAARVRRAIEQLNYFPNRYAQSLVSGRSRMLGLIVSDITNPFFPELIARFQDIAVQNGYDVLVASTNYDSGRMALCTNRMLRHQVDGVAIMTSEMDPAFTESLATRKVPMVFLDVGEVGKNVSNIRIDYSQGIAEAIEHLRVLGHHRIAFISGPSELKSARIRREAFLRELMRGEIAASPDLIEEGNHKVDGGFHAVQKLMRRRPAPTAVLASNDLTAIGAMRGIREAGLTIPGDISVIGFDDVDMAQFTDPPLTTVRLARAEIASQAFELLLHSIHGHSAGKEIRIGTCLVPRLSTAKAALAVTTSSGL